MIRIHKINRQTQTNRHTCSFIMNSFIQHVLHFVSICLHIYGERIYMQIHIYSHVQFHTTFPWGKNLWCAIMWLTSVHRGIRLLWNTSYNILRYNASVSMYLFPLLGWHVHKQASDAATLATRHLITLLSTLPFLWSNSFSLIPWCGRYDGVIIQVIVKYLTSIFHIPTAICK